MLMLACSGSVISFASFYINDGEVVNCPGNVRVFTEPENYNYAWLDSVIVRDGSLAVTPLTVVPVTEYPYSHTYDEFINDCRSYMTLFEASDSTVQRTIMDMLKSVYYTLVATGRITDSTQDMRAYNESRGIVYPYTESKFTDLYTVLTYSCLEKDLYKVVTDNDVEIVKGTTVEGAVVQLLSAVCDMSTASNVESISSFSYLFTEKYIVDESGYPVSDEPSEEEVYYWVKLKAAQEAGYSVPATTKYEDLSASQIENVTYSYYSSILTTRYEIPVDPMSLKASLLSGDANNEVPKLVLKSMLDNVSMEYSDNLSSEELFDLVLKEGYFDIDNQFYTDIYNYNIFVEPECEKVWITSFPVASQLVDGELDSVKTYINDKLVENNSTNDVAVPGNGTTFTVKTAYDGKDDVATYVFNVIKTGEAAEKNEAVQIDLAEPFSDIASDVADVIDNALDNAVIEPSTISPTEGYTFNTPVAEITTYAIDEVASDSSSVAATTDSLFETYPVDENGEVVTTNSALILETASEEETEQTTVSVLDNVVETVKENPTVVAAPVGLIAVGASAGFLFYYRRKDDDSSKEID